MTYVIHSLPSAIDAVLVLADGSSFYGQGIGKAGDAIGELCFNTGMTGYQEVITDPSYSGQIITFTFPHIGNVGANEEDIEAKHVHVRGIVLRESITSPSNYRSMHHLDDWLKASGVTGITGIDTRRLTNHLREAGAQTAVIAYQPGAESFNLEALKRQAQGYPTLDGADLVKDLISHGETHWMQTIWDHEKGYGRQQETKFHVVAIDYGEKLNILRHLAHRGCRVSIVSATATSDDILALKPDGVFLSNGPGDPAATGNYAIPVLRELVEHGVPIFGICLGHQLLSLAMGGKTVKMHQGHRGVNHPVKNLETGHVEITSQNHGFVVDIDSLPDTLIPTHISLFDHTLEGVRVKDKPAFSVQYHPESSPGPHDSRYLFDQFVAMMQAA